MNALVGKKTEQLQRFLEDGRRIPVTVLRIPELSIVQVKTHEKDGYTAVQVGVDTKKQTKTPQSLLGHLKKSGAKTPLFLREIHLTADEALPNVGDTIKAEDVLAPGDVVWVTGTSKGKGFAGGVKRYGFGGGPRTHGQSDRERAPGSIGQTTTPGRVYKGKKMAGNMGKERVTVKNLTVVSVNPQENTVLVAGLVPGYVGSYVEVVKMGTEKDFTPLLKNQVEKAKEEAEAAEAAKAEEEAKNAQEEDQTTSEPEAAQVADATDESPVESPAAPTEDDGVPAEEEKKEEA